MDNQKGKAGCGTFILVWAISAAVFAVLFAAINKTGQSMGIIVSVSAIIGFMIAFVVIAFRMAVLTSKASKRAKRQKKKDMQDGISRYSGVIHVAGLAAPENCKVSIVLSSSSLTVNCGGREFVLGIKKIKNVDFQLDVNETQYLKSSMAKGIAGAAAFGVAGAIIGSAPQTKTKRNVKGYAIISYESVQGEYKTFLLRDETENTLVCARLVDNLRPRINQQINRVEL